MAQLLVDALQVLVGRRNALLDARQAGTRALGASGPDWPRAAPMTPPKSRQRMRQLDFHRGVLAALTCVADFDQGTLYDTIVRCAGPRRLIAAAQGEEFDLEHLRKYGWVTKCGHFKRNRR
jgi:hypothetical protein